MANGQAWCEQNTWRMQEREKWRYAYAGNKIVRYLDNPPLQDLEAVLDYLTGAYGCSKLSLDGKPVTGSWITLRAWYELANTDGSGVQRPRVYHEIIPAADTGSDTAYVQENNCTYVVTVTPYFRQASVTAPTAGSSGITYRVVGETRDRETGLWTYQIEKREQLTTTTGVVTLEDDAFKTVYGQTFMGVRTGNLDHTGAAVALWPVDDSTQGTLVVEAMPSKNENCTVDITQRKVVAKAAENVSVERYVTAFETGVTITNRNQAAAVNAAVGVADGIITRRSSRQNDDDTFDNTETLTTAVARSDAVVERYVTAFETGVTITNRNQPVAVNAAVAVADGIITRRSSRMTDGLRYDNTETVTTAVAQSDAVVERYVTAFETGVTITNRNQSAAVNAAVAVSDGIITRRSSRLTDAGRYDNTETLTTAVAQSDAVVERYETAFEIGVTITNRNQTAAVNELVEVADGIITRRSSRMTDGLLYDNTETLTTEREVSEAVKTVRVTPFETVSRVTDRGQTAAAADPTTPGVSVTKEKSEAGRFANTTEAVTPTANVDKTKLKTIQGLDTIEETLTRNEAAAPTLPATQTPGTAETVEWVKTDENQYDVRRRIETGEKFVQSFTLPDERGNITIIRYFNHTLAEEQALLAALDAGRNNSASPGAINKYAKYDGVIVSRPASGAASGSGSEFAVEETGLKQDEKRLVTVDGVRKVQTWTYTYNVKKDWGISGGWTAYSGAKQPGSFFHDLGNDWYEYKKVTGISVAETAFTPGAI